MEKVILKPNLFIVGAPKCGTTSLGEYLNSHPEVFMSSPKEPDYFCKDFNKSCADSLEDYLHLFSDADENHKVFGEASVWYLFSEKAASAVYQFNPKAKIIIMLRNPVDLLHSLHSQFLWTLDEDIEDFEKAWSLQESRKKGHHIPAKCSESKFLQYAQVGRLSHQVKRYLDIFPENQVKIILFEDFVKATDLVFKDVLSFLNVNSDLTIRYKAHNKNKQHRNKLLASFTQKPPATVVKLLPYIKKIMKVRRLNMMGKMKNLNNKQTVRPSLSPSFRYLLNNEFRDDIRRLSELTNKRLDHWIFQ